MLICLQIVALSQVAYYVLYVTFVTHPIHSDYHMKLYSCLTDILGNVPILFLELAILMNITKWIYFILALKAHRNIRHYEISREVFAEREGRSTLLPDDSLTRESSTEIRKPTFKDN